MMLTETIICDNGELTMSDLVCSADLLSGSVHFVPMADCYANENYRNTIFLSTYCCARKRKTG